MEYLRADKYCDLVTDGTHDSPKRQSEGHYLITSKHIKGSEIDYDNAYKISEEDYLQIIQRSRVDQWDVLISMIGTCGITHIVTEENPDFAVKNVGILKTGSKEKSLWLYYFLNSPEGKNYLETIKTGSTQPYISLSELRKIPVPLPDENKRDAICSLLSAIDDKIINNNQINQNLEEQASAYFNEWFSSITGETIELSSVIDVRDGTHDSPKAQEEGYPLVTSKHLLPFDLDLASPNKISEDDFNKVNERSKVEQMDILMSMIGTVGLVSFIHQDVINFAIKNVALFRTSQVPDLALYLLMYLKSEKITQHIDMCLAGSTQKYISLSELRKIPFIVPAETSIREFNQVIKPMIDGICTNVRENSRLVELRDALLPKLMSGEIDVSEITI